MTDALPTVLFVDEDPVNLNPIFLHVEPVLHGLTCHDAAVMRRHVEKFQPDVIVISDRMRDADRPAREIVADLRSTFRGGIIVLTDSIDARDRAIWQELGASACVLHPGRLMDRILELQRAIQEATAHARAG